MNEVFDVRPTLVDMFDILEAPTDLYGRPNSGGL